MPTIGGVLIILSSLGYFILGVVIAAGSTIALVPSIGSSAVGIVCGIALVVLGIIALMGGVYAMQRKNFTLAVIGGIFVIPSILGLIGLILVAMSKEEFTS